MRTVKNLILIIALLFSFPASAFMADIPQGKVIINIYDENNKPYVGNWFLHQGINEKGSLVRNGSGGETFNFTPGKYFLVVYKSEDKHPYRTIFSTNPQTLNVNETATYNVQYFKTAEEMANATAPALPTPATAPETNPAPTPDTVTAPSTETVTSATPETDTSTPATTESPTQSRTYMGPRVTLANLPHTDVSPAAESGSSSSDSENLPLQLAQTGSPAFLLLIFSGLLGGIAVRKKK